MIFIGVDVGAAGGIALIDASGVALRAVHMPETDVDILSVLEHARGLGWHHGDPQASGCRAVLEKVHSSPQMGVVSAFSFGGAYRSLRMALAAKEIPFDEVSPMKWQRRLECLSGGDKNVTKARAQQLFPGVKVTHAIADALLLAEFCRRTQLDLS